VTGLVLKTEVDEYFTGAKLVSGNDTLELTPEEQHDPSELSTFSNLINFSPPINEFLFYPGNIDSPITFYFIDAQTGKKTSANQMKKKSDGCATECPGDSLYHSLISLRQQVMDSFQYCGYAVEPVSLEGYKTGHVKIRYGTGEIIFDIDTQLTQLVFYDIYGRRYYPETINIGPESYSISTLGLPVGIYFAVFLTEYEKQVFKVAVY
jgi:hypothetical protein